MPFKINRENTQFNIPFTKYLKINVAKIFSNLSKLAFQRTINKSSTKCQSRYHAGATSTLAHAYTGITRNTFKKLIQWTVEHQNTFNNLTTLSAHTWKTADMNCDMMWNILDMAPDFNLVTRNCRLWLKENMFIIFQPEVATLNKSSKLSSTCRQRLRLLH